MDPSKTNLTFFHIYASTIILNKAQNTDSTAYSSANIDFFDLREKIDWKSILLSTDGVVVCMVSQPIVQGYFYLLMLCSHRNGQPPGQIHHNQVQWQPGYAVSNNIF